MSDATTESPPENALAPSPAKSELKTDVDLMRFTHAWLNHVTSEAGDTDERRSAIRVILGEFGQRQGCLTLLDPLSAL